MPYYCTVPRCTSMAGKARDVSFHQFPRDAALAAHWNLVLKRGKPYTKYSKVCSRHFTAQDYTCTTVGKNKGHWRTLRKDAVPSQNLPDESPTATACRNIAPRADGDFSEQQIQQQLAHAVYVQTMLAMHAANAAAALPSQPASNASDGTHSEEEDSQQSTPSKEQTPQSETNEERGWHATDVVRDELGHLHPVVTRAGWYHRDTITDSNPSVRKRSGPVAAAEPTRTAFECEDCSKCFKDPDVFLLHKRWHMSGQGKPDASEMLGKMMQPKDSDGQTPTFDPLNLEHQILMAMRKNMESYIKSMVSIGQGQSEVSLSEECVDSESKGESVHESEASGRLMEANLNSGG